jgi:hypothetical protein
MTTKELIIGSALLLGAAFTAAVGTSSAAQAQYYRHWYGHHHRGLYNYYGGYSEPDVGRGGPGPRVDGGSGMGIGAVR